MKKILIGMPTLGSLNISMANFLYQLIDYYHDKYEISIVHTQRSDVSMARNKIMKSITDEDYLLFLDDDNIPTDIKFLDKLVESDKDIISGIIPSRLPDANGLYKLCICDEIIVDGERKYKHYINIPEGPELFKIANCGMGCVLIKADIVKDMIKRYNYPCEIREVTFYIDGEDIVRDDEVDYTQITKDIKSYKRYMSEDMLFFDRVKSLLGVEIYAHKGVECVHIGPSTEITITRNITARNKGLGLILPEKQKIDLAVGITLAPRQNPTINQSIDSLRQAGYSGIIHIMAEPGEYNIKDSNINLMINQERLGAFKNFDKLIRFLSSLDNEYIFYTQDDFIYKPYFLEKIGEQINKDKDFGFISPFSDFRVGHFMASEGWQNINMGRGCCGAVFVFNKENLLKIIQSNYYNWHLNNYEKNKQIDACIGRVCDELKLNTYYHNPSLVAHIGQYSTIGHDENNKKTFNNFYYKPIKDKKVVVGIASQPVREKSLELVVASLYNQVDQLNIFLNNYNEVPEFLNQPKIKVFRGDNSLGDAGKFYELGKEDCYYFGCDDDILYPSDYVDKTIKKLKYYEKEYGPCIVGYHGNQIIKPFQNYFKDKKTFYYNKTIDKDYFIDILGTGVCAFSTSLIKMSIADFKEKNMADLWVSLYANQNNIPLVLLEHKENWIKVLPAGEQEEAIRRNINVNTQSIWIKNNLIPILKS